MIVMLYVYNCDFISILMWNLTSGLYLTNYDYYDLFTLKTTNPG